MAQIKPLPQDERVFCLLFPGMHSWLYGAQRPAAIKGLMVRTGHRGRHCEGYVRVSEFGSTSLRFFSLSGIFFWQIPRKYLKLPHHSFITHFFPFIMHSPFVMWLLRASLNELQLNKTYSIILSSTANLRCLWHVRNIRCKRRREWRLLSKWAARKV
jgi:hypothetical protein